MPKRPFQHWLTLQERQKNHSFFIVEWVSIFTIAWLFWSLMFFSVPGSLPPWQTATIIAALYASCVVYGRVLRLTGCRKCGSPLPLLRQEIGRRHTRDQEHRVEREYGGPQWDRHFVDVYCRVQRNDIVTYRCSKCDQIWEEKIELPGSNYKFLGRMDLDE
jgi:hypothetical protein